MSVMPMRQDCKYFESRTSPNGDTVRKCDLDLAPEAPWRCPDDCPKFTRRLADVNWSYGSLVTPEILEGTGLEGCQEVQGQARPWAIWRGLVRVEGDAYGCKSHVQCDALILDEDSVSGTYPYMEVGSGDAVIGHEATVSKVADEQLFYLKSRGLTEEQAMGLIVNGFIEPVTRTLPMEYAVEWSRLIELQMEGSVG